MNRMVVESRVGADGVLHVPIGQAAANTDVRVTIESVRAPYLAKAPMPRQEWLDFLASTAGAWQGEFERPEQGELEERDPFP